MSSDHSIFPDETMRYLFKNQSTLATGKVVRDHYEQLLQEKSRTYQHINELYRTALNENQNIKRELMYLRGILHSRGLMDEFRGYLRGIIQPKTNAPMSTKKLYLKMLELGTNQSTDMSIISPLSNDLFSCVGKSNNVTTVEKEALFNTIAYELDYLYSRLSESIHAIRIGRHDRDFVICT